MADQLATLVERPFQTIPDVVTCFSQLERFFQDKKDQRAVFVTAYLRITRAIQKDIESNAFFHDGAWMTSYLIAFANKYREASYHYDMGRLDLVPKSWRLSFDASSQGKALVIQDLILGINAHINHDLPLALFDAGLDPHRNEKHRDHNRINDVIKDVINDIQDRISAYYSRSLGVLDRLFGKLDEKFSSFSFEKAREHSWEMAVALADARTPEARDRLKKRLDDQADILGRLILIPNVAAPWLLEALKFVDQGSWWNNINVLGVGS